MTSNSPDGKWEMFDRTMAMYSVIVLVGIPSNSLVEEIFSSCIAYMYMLNLHVPLHTFARFVTDIHVYSTQNKDFRNELGSVTGCTYK